MKLFISDLHLHESRPDITRAFYQFLRDHASKAESLYILGDFFDAWVGDDNDEPLTHEVAAHLLQLSQNGTHIFLMHGNRDFLLGEDFARRAGASMLAEGTVIDLEGCPTLLLHGDSLCTDDKVYQEFRQQVRSPEWQRNVLAQPLAARRALAAKIRAESQSMNSLKAEEIMDVTEDAVVSAMKSAGVTRMIHGHTHRPARHPLEINGVAAERIVLGDWQQNAWCLCADKKALTLESWSLSALDH